MSHLFAYGTLMCEDIMNDVSGCRLSSMTAVLLGYSRRRVKGQDYPALLPRENARVGGVVYLDVPPMAWQRLDRFEGEMYSRRRVQVELADGQVLTASTYVVQPGFIHELDTHEWDFDEFLTNGKARFQKRYRGYQQLQ